MKKEFYSVEEIAKMYRYTPSNIYSLIRKNRIKSERHGHRHMIKRDWMDEYIKNRHSRELSMNGNRRIFSENRISIKKAAEILNVSYFQVYSWITSGILTSSRLRQYHILNKEEVIKFMEDMKSDKRLRILAKSRAKK